ncbi:hypothetical protein GCM10025777_08460 [Membranihabitans marinus]
MSILSSASILIITSGPIPLTSPRVRPILGLYIYMSYIYQMNKDNILQSSEFYINTLIFNKIILWWVKLIKAIDEIHI